MNNRRSIRIPDYDYSQEGMYFVTICAQDRECLFGEIDDEEMILNGDGKIVDEVWNILSDRFPIHLDYYQIMPNHLHGIIEITNNRAIRESPLQRSILSQCIGYFKMNTTKKIHSVGAHHDAPIKIFQRNYYEHVIRNDQDLNRIREYIQLNPIRWEDDEENPKNLRSV